MAAVSKILKNNKTNVLQRVDLQISMCYCMRVTCQYPYVTVRSWLVNIRMTGQNLYVAIQGWLVIIHTCTHKPAHHLLCSWHTTFLRPSLIHILCRRTFVLKKQKWCFDFLTVVDPNKFFINKVPCTYMPVQLFLWDSTNTYYHVFHLETQRSWDTLQRKETTY